MEDSISPVWITVRIDGQLVQLNCEYAIQSYGRFEYSYRLLCSF